MITCKLCKAEGHNGQRFQRKPLNVVLRSMDVTGWVSHARMRAVHRNAFWEDRFFFFFSQYLLEEVLWLYNNISQVTDFHLNFFHSNGFYLGLVLKLTSSPITLCLGMKRFVGIPGLFTSPHSVCDPLTGLPEWSCAIRAEPGPCVGQLPKFQDTQFPSLRCLKQETAFLTLSWGYKLIEVMQENLGHLPLEIREF